MDRGEPLSIWDPDPFYDKKIPKTHTLFITTPSILVPCLGQRTKCTPLCFKAILTGITPLEHSNAHYLPSRPLPLPPAPQKKKLHIFCFSFLLGITAVPREIENNVYAKYWGASGVLQEQIHVIIVAYILGVQKKFI